MTESHTHNNTHWHNQNTTGSSSNASNKAHTSSGDIKAAAESFSPSPSLSLDTTESSVATTSSNSPAPNSTPTPSRPKLSSPLSLFTSTAGPSNALGRLAAISATGTLTPPNSTAATPARPTSPLSPVRFAATTDAFGLPNHHHHSTDTANNISHSPTSSTSPNSATPARRLRRPSLLSLAPTTTTQERLDPRRHDPSPTPPMDLAPTDGSSTPMSIPPTTTVHPQPAQRWGVSPLSPLTSISGAPPRVGSAPPIAFEGLTTRASPILGRRGSDLADDRPHSMDVETSTMTWASEIQRRRASRIGADGDDLSTSRLPFSGRPLPGPLLATLISETAPLKHEMQSEARYQRLISSHPSVFPLTPRQRRNTRWTRGRFPEMVGDDDDDDEDVRQLGSRWLAGSSDTDSDDMVDDSAPDWHNNSSSMSAAAGAVNSAFASVMDLDRPPSSGSSGAWASASGKSTPGTRTGSAGPAPGTSSTSTAAAPTPPPQWRTRPPAVSSPGTGLQLPTAFGGLGMGGSATPLGSPTVEKNDLACSPSAVPTTPGMMQYREPTSGRPGKRKAVDDRFDPYKRPRGSSPSPFQSTASPSKPNAIPIPSSPSHLPHVGSALAMGSPGYLSLGGSGRPKTAHGHSHSRSYAHARPMASRSRAASPALSIGSTSSVLSTSLGNGNLNGGLNGGSRPLGGPFIPTGHGAAAAVNAANAQGAAPSSLGGLGFLSLGAGQAALKEEDESAEDAMEED